MAEIYISLGSNINRQHHIEQGLNALTDEFGVLTCLLYTSDAADE